MDKNQKTVIALGFFDGIHLGHGALLDMAKRRAAELGAVPAVLTFDAHPDTFVKKVRIELISSAADRIYIARRYYGIERVFFLHFNERTMHMSWRDFIDEIAEKYGAVHFVVGHDFHCGYRGEGSAQVLREYCLARGIGFDIIAPVMQDGEVISSTRIRGLLENGDMERVNALLGHPYLITDTIHTGYRIGRTIEAPTINMRFQENVLIPRHGVYATMVELPEGVHKAVTNIGMRPTFDGDRITVETNILDFEGDLYGQPACVSFYRFLRPERRFASAQALMNQIKQDAEEARKILC